MEAFLPSGPCKARKATTVKFIKRNFWGIALAICFLAALLAGIFSSPWWIRCLWVAASFGTGISSWLCFSHSLFSEPRRFVITNTDWTVPPGGQTAPENMPFVSIPRARHKRGRSPRVEFQQVDPIYGVPNFPITNNDGDIIITRPFTQSMPPYPTFAVLIHKN